MPTPPLASARSSRALSTVVGTAALSAMLAAGVAHAQSGSGWTEFQGGPSKTGALAVGPQPGYRELWSTPFAPAGPGERFGLSAPIVTDGFVIAVGPEQVVGLDVSSGDEAFAVERELGPSVPAAVATIGDGTAVVYTEGWGDGPPAPQASPAPEPSPSGPGDATGTDDAESHLAAFDLETQEASWPPVALGGVSRTGVTVVGASGFVGVNDGTVTAVDLQDGSVLWEQDLGAALVTPLAAADGLVLAGLQGDAGSQPAVVALDAVSGEERWRHEPSAASALVSAVSAADGRAFATFSALTETSVTAIDTADGAELWSVGFTAAFDVVAPPVIGAGAVFVTDLDGHTRALATDTGQERWDFAQNILTARSVPLLVGSHLLVPGFDGELGAIDAATGELVWRRPADGSPIVALAPAGDLLMALRKGVASGIEAFERDPDAPLVREASPTTLALGRMIGSMALAAVPVLALTLLLGRMLTRRSHASDDDEPVDPDRDDDEPIRDPWEDGDPAP